MRTKAVRDRMKNAGTQLCNVSMSAGFFQTQNNLIGISSCNAGPELTKNVHESFVLPNISHGIHALQKLCRNLLRDML